MWKHFIIHKQLPVYRAASSDLTDLMLLENKGSAPACAYLFPLRTINQGFTRISSGSH